MRKVQHPLFSNFSPEWKKYHFGSKTGKKALISCSTIFQDPESEVVWHLVRQAPMYRIYL